jgi:hypothetical protein
LKRAPGGAASLTLRTSSIDSFDRVLPRYAPVLPLGWLVFVELPIEEANALAQ